MVEREEEAGMAALTSVNDADDRTTVLSLRDHGMNPATRDCTLAVTFSLSKVLILRKGTERIDTVAVLS
jgi:hypothetical protein